VVQRSEKNENSVYGALSRFLDRVRGAETVGNGNGRVAVARVMR